MNDFPVGEFLRYYLFCVKNARYILRWETLSLAGYMALYGKKYFVNVIVLAFSFPHKRKRQFAILFASPGALPYPTAERLAFVFALLSY